jgi:hypothetical protein
MHTKAINVRDCHDNNIKLPEFDKSCSTVMLYSASILPCKNLTMDQFNENIGQSPDLCKNLHYMQHCRDNQFPLGTPEERNGKVYTQ